MYLSDRLPRSGKLPKIQPLLPLLDTGESRSIWSLIFFLHYVHGPSMQLTELTGILASPGGSVFEGAF